MLIVLNIVGLIIIHINLNDQIKKQVYVLCRVTQLLIGSYCKTWEKISIFLKNGKKVISVDFISRNLVTPSNFIGFRDSRNFTFFETSGVGWHMA